MPEFSALINEMQRLHQRGLATGEHAELPQSITHGNGILILLEHRYGAAGYAQTQERLGLQDDIISYLQGMLEEAAASLGLTEDDLRRMYDPATIQPI